MNNIKYHEHDYLAKLRGILHPINNLTDKKLTVGITTEELEYETIIKFGLFEDSFLLYGSYYSINNKTIKHFKNNHPNEDYIKWTIDEFIIRRVKNDLVVAAVSYFTKLRKDFPEGKQLDLTQMYLKLNKDE